MSVKIEKGIPAPVKGSNYPIMEMEVGDSFLLTDRLKRNAVSSMCSIYGKRYKRKYISKNVDKGVRYWRIA